MDYKLLPQINSPADLKKLDITQLPALADEIRCKIMEVVARNGGHLGSNLGVIELSIALHYVFNLDNDRLLWDVSHQCYTHKILSGRLKEFESLRTYGGISGFTNPAESPYDAMVAGHAGTAISTALGIVCGDELSGNHRKTIAVVGDGAITCGMSWEAINHAGILKKDITVILNDNTMSISRTIGAMANYLNKLRMTHLYEGLKKDAYTILDRVPVVGRPMEKALDHLRAAAVATLGGMVFEELGWSYYGPIDGHNIPLIIQRLKDIQRFKKPVLLHIVTEKGCGSPDALEDPYRMHGVAPGQPNRTQTAGADFQDNKLNSVDQSKSASLPVNQCDTPKPASPNYTDIFSEAIVKLARQNNKITAITAAMPDGTGLVDFHTEFPQRYYDVGICEQHAVGLACGLANSAAVEACRLQPTIPGSNSGAAGAIKLPEYSGLRPVVAVYSTFLQRAFDQLFHEIGLQKSKVVFAMDRAGLVGADGPTHHGMFDIAYTRIFPGFILMAPKDAPELEQMLAFALTLDGPSFIRYPRCTVPPPFTSTTPIALGRSEVLREGKDGVFLAYGSMVAPAYQAALELAKEGIEFGLVNARFAKPLDESLLTKLIMTDMPIVTVEEHALTGGFGSAVLEFANTLKDGKARIIRLGIPDRFIEHGSRNKLLEITGLDVNGIIKSARKCFTTKALSH